MKLIEVTPYPCLYCGQGNGHHKDGSRRRFVDLERDVNWNDPVILCEDCATMVGTAIGLLSPDTIAETKAELRAKAEEIHELKATQDEMKRRATKLGMEFAA
jgi:hypothetical protein